MYALSIRIAALLSLAWGGRKQQESSFTGGYAAECSPKIKQKGAVCAVDMTVALYYHKNERKK
jgi:hypothetical protein